MIDRMQREFRGPPAAKGSQRPHAFESHERRGIVHGRCEKFHRRFKTVSPIADDPGRCRAGPRIGRRQHRL